jgi:predicted transcriptional regulator of viral defense system
MKIEELSELVLPGGLFRTGLILAGQRSPQDVRRQIDRWVKSGRILKLRRGVYMLVKPYVELAAHPFVVANTLKKASYVSLQSALAHYGMIPEYVPVTTSITTGRPEEVETPIGRFQFRHVAPQLFFGFTEIEISRNQQVLLATAQKALIDLLYLTAHSDDVDYLRELRLERPEHFDLAKLHRAAERSGSSKVERCVDRLTKLWELDVSDETTSD